MDIRKKADPYGTFTANAFAVKRAETTKNGTNGNIASEKNGTNGKSQSG